MQPRITLMVTVISTDVVALYKLLAWASPAFPTGGFSYSHGLEAAAADGTVHDRATLETWIAATIALGSGRIDTDTLRDAWRAAEADDGRALAEADRRGVAHRATAELALESAQQAAAFAAAYEAAWDPHRATAEAPAMLSRGTREGLSASAQNYLSCNSAEGGCGGSAERGESSCHAAVFGAAAARGGISLESALTGYLQAFAANLMSTGLRLGIVGQSDGQRILAALGPMVAAAVAASLLRDREDFGSATFALDLASMAHETLYTRLFRS
jgi:urease accessory protein